MLTYLMTYLVLKGGGGGFIVWAGIGVLIFFSIPVVIMLGYTVSYIYIIYIYCFKQATTTTLVIIRYFSTESFIL